MLVRAMAIGLVLAAISGTAFAADYGAAAADPGASPNWQGAYIGGSVGYSWGTANLSATGGGAGSLGIDPTGFLVGAQAGYDFHVSDRIVAGLEGNLDWTNQQVSVSTGGPSLNYNTNFEGSVRGRLGYDIGNAMPYVEAGVAFANATISAPGVTTNSPTYTGWTAGAGLEYMIADNISANIEYRYSDYGTQTFLAGGLGSGLNSHFTDSSVRLGVDYHF